MIDKTAYIATFHCVPNYGAVLQAYGLQSYLGTLLRDVRVLDYRPETLLLEYKSINTFSVASILMSLWSLPSFMRKKKAFARFENRLNLSDSRGKKAGDFDLQDADFIFLGSDQVWNPDVTRGFDPVFFGAIKGKSTLKRISYAASIGKGKYSAEEIIQMKQLLNNVDEVSVRENEAQKILLTNFGVQSSVVADPTILAGVDVFLSLVRPVKYCHYIFVYTLTNNPSTLRVAKEISKKYRLQIVQVNGNRKELRKQHHIVINDAGPEMFLSLLYHSDYVITDSFHGTVFSTLFHRPFVTIPHKTRGGRMVTLLTELGMLSQLSESSGAIDNSIDWCRVEQRLKTMRNKSTEFIIKSIEE